jgi:hypothetical protein
MVRQGQTVPLLVAVQAVIVNLPHNRFLLEQLMP